ncbi:hypothetical protein FACS1894152_1710 [Bacilli bacterium]|nr:hypothetical protein FACS1894152_1710 [Bacilli bacterium]
MRHVLYRICPLFLITLTLAMGCWAKKPFVRDIEKVGDALQLIVPAFVFGRTLHETDDSRDSLKQFVKHFVAINGTVYLAKILIDEKRPNGENMDSFPSGHTAAAFTGATFVHFRYSFGEAKYLYTLAAFTAFSRVYANKHHLHDTLASIALSFVSSYIFVTGKNDRANYFLNYKPENRELSFNVSFSF